MAYLFDWTQKLNQVAVKVGQFLPGQADTSYGVQYGAAARAQDATAFGFIEFGRFINIVDKINREFVLAGITAQSTSLALIVDDAVGQGVIVEGAIGGPANINVPVSVIPASTPDFWERAVIISPTSALSDIQALAPGGAVNVALDGGLYAVPSDAPATNIALADLEIKSVAFQPTANKTINGWVIMIGRKV